LAWRLPCAPALAITHWLALQVRELSRIKRERDQREARRAELAEIERRRHMTDEEIRAEQKVITNAVWVYNHSRSLNICTRFKHGTCAASVVCPTQL
jgi:hypothetical protein